MSASTAAGERGDVPSPAAVLTQKLLALMNALDQAYADACREVGVTTAQAQLLCAAARPAPVGALAEQLRCERTNITHLAGRARARGWVREGSRAPQDARVRFVELTDEGSALVHDLTGALVRRIGERLSSWSTEERRTAHVLIDDMLTALGSSSV